MQSYDGSEYKPCICVIIVLSSYDRRKVIATKEDHARFFLSQKRQNLFDMITFIRKKGATIQILYIFVVKYNKL